MKTAHTVSKSEQELLNRLNRVQGQIEALKRVIERGDRDCLENVQQVKAVHAAVKRFAQAYVENYAQVCARTERVSPAFERNIKEIVASAFTL